MVQGLMGSRGVTAGIGFSFGFLGRPKGCITHCAVYASTRAPGNRKSVEDIWGVRGYRGQISDQIGGGGNACN